MSTDHNRSAVQHFNRWSDSYERSLAQPFFFDRVHGAVLNLVAGHCRGREPETVLDVGCGTGRLLRRVGQRWPAARLIGVDAAEGMVEAARRLTPNATLSVAVAESLPLPDASVDVALSTLSFHHWNDQSAGVREIARVLRPGGCFVLADIPGTPGYTWIIRHFPVPDRPATPAEIRSFFAQAGLQLRTQQRALLGAVLITAAAKQEYDQTYGVQRRAA